VGHRRLRGAFIAAATIALLAGVTAGTVLTLRPSRSTPITDAVAGYKEDRLPGSATPQSAAPDLSSLRMTGVGAGAGRLDHMPVTAYAYRDNQGRRLMIYVATTSFPMPEDAHRFHGTQGAWMAHQDGVTVLASRAPHELLILSEDQKLAHAAAVALDVM
jgi:hypothetical protein